MRNDSTIKELHDALAAKLADEDEKTFDAMIERVRRFPVIKRTRTRSPVEWAPEPAATIVSMTD